MNVHCKNSQFSLIATHRSEPSETIQTNPSDALRVLRAKSWICAINILQNLSEILQILYLLTQSNKQSETWCVIVYTFLAISTLLNIINICSGISIPLNLSSQAMLLIYLVKLEINNIGYIILIITSLIHLSIQIRSRVSDRSSVHITPEPGSGQVLPRT
jgi:hypothetical protein